MWMGNVGLWAMPTSADGSGSFLLYDNLWKAVWYALAPNSHSALKAGQLSNGGIYSMLLDEPFTTQPAVNAGQAQYIEGRISTETSLV